MKRCLSIVVLALLAFAHPTLAQTGTVSGSVLDRQTDDPLVGAIIFLEGTQIGITCDVEGRFQLFDVPVGTYVLASSMIGYQDASIIGVEVQDGEVAKLTITLSPEALELDDEVIVEAKALRNTGAALLKERQKAPAVSDAISAEEISRAGSGDAAEAMSHVTGASVVEGKYVYIRGLGDRDSSVQLNGSSLPNADADKRSVPMDLFPTSLLDNIVTTKSFTPDKPGNFTGGAVNIGTKAFPDNFTLSVSASTKFNTQSTFNDQFLTYDGGGLDWIGVDDGTREIPATLSGDAEIPDVGAAYNDEEKARQLDEYSKSFSSVMAPTTAPAPLNQSYSVALGNQVSLLDKPFGFLGTLIYSNNSSFYDNGTSARWQLTSKEASTLTNNFNLTDTQGSQEIAWGSLVTLSLKPAPTHELSVTNMYNRNSEDVARYLAGAFPRDLKEDAIYETRFLKFTERQIQSLQLAGKHHFDSLRDLRAEWTASTSSSAQEEPDLRFFTNNYVTLTNRPLRDANGEVLRDGEGNVLRGDIVDYSISPSIYPLPTRYFRDLEEDNREFQLNLSLPFKQWQGINSNFKTGFLALDKQRTFRERRYEFDQDDIGYDGQPDTFFGSRKGRANQQRWWSIPLRLLRPRRRPANLCWLRHARVAHQYPTAPRGRYPT